MEWQGREFSLSRAKLDGRLMSWNVSLALNRQKSPRVHEARVPSFLTVCKPETAIHRERGLAPNLEGFGDKVRRLNQECRPMLVLELLSRREGCRLQAFARSHDLGRVAGSRDCKSGATSERAQSKNNNNNKGPGQNSD